MLSVMCSLLRWNKPTNSYSSKVLEYASEGMASILNGSNNQYVSFIVKFHAFANENCVKNMRELGSIAPIMT